MHIWPIKLIFSIFLDWYKSIYYLSIVVNQNIDQPGFPSNLVYDSQKEKEREEYDTTVGAKRQKEGEEDISGIQRKELGHNMGKDWQV